MTMTPEINPSERCKIAAMPRNVTGDCVLFTDGKIEKGISSDVPDTGIVLRSEAGSESRHQAKVFFVSFTRFKLTM